MISTSALLATQILRLIRLWKPYSSEELLKKHIAALRAKELKQARKRPVSSQWEMDVSTRLIADGRSGQLVARVLYLPGGAYVEPPLSAHWSFISDMSRRLQAEFVVVRYPLAPEHSVSDTMGYVLDVYRGLIAKDDLPLFVMGDSAGGGLALALLQEAANQGLKMPCGLVMISPWLDCTMSSVDEQKKLEPKDVMLRRAGLLAAGRWYAGRLDTVDPMVSPLFGRIDMLPPTLLFGGGRDLLVTDARQFAEKARGQGLRIEFRDEAEMFHTWPLVPFPFPERTRAKKEIGKFVRRQLGQDGGNGSTHPS